MVNFVEGIFYKICLDFKFNISRSFATRVFVQNERMKRDFVDTKLLEKHETEFNHMIPKQFVRTMHTKGVSIRKLLK